MKLPGLLIFFSLSVTAFAMEPVTLTGSQGAKATVQMTDDALLVDFSAPGIPGHAVYVALDTDPGDGSHVLPFGKNREGSTVFLPFEADYMAIAKVDGGHLRKWESTMWSSGSAPPSEGFKAQFSEKGCRFEFPKSDFGINDSVRFTVYAKDLSKRDGWGELVGSLDETVEAGGGDKTITFGVEVNSESAPAVRLQPRFPTAERVRIYQLFVRLFGNANETRKPNGTLEENGTGKFSHINDAALKSLRAMNFSHLWLTGVLQQATATDYSAIGQPADDPDLLKGLAGSPYAIKDYFDVSPDYADEPAERLAEFKALLGRIHAHGMKALIDFVPNHVARSYGSDVKPEVNFGNDDDRTKFFAPNNNFFYLKGEGPLRLPTCKDGKAISPTCKVLEGQCDGLFEPETEFGKVTGNNVNSWSPNLGDWYETVKLNYGYDFTDPDTREYPHGAHRDKPIPDTWLKMDVVIRYWQEMDVDGFRCDMSHMVPPEFWRWLIHRARARDPEVFFMAEAYDDDPAKVAGGDPVLLGLNDGKGNVMFDLLNAGFNSVYDHPSYKKVKDIYDGGSWANDIDRVRTEDFIFNNSLRYAENHDEVRLASKEWRGLGMDVGRPVTALLFALGRGPLMVYSGQEVGEKAEGVEGFGGDDNRSSLFDYWSLPALVPWVKGHAYDGGKLGEAEKDLRDFYGRLLGLMNEPAFRRGIHVGLNAANEKEPAFGKVKGDKASGHWLYACLRHDEESGQTFLVVVNLHPEQTFENVRVRFPAEIAQKVGLAAGSEWADRLGTDDLKIEGTLSGVNIATIRPLTPHYLALEKY